MSVSWRKRKHVTTRHPEVPYKLVIQRPKIVAVTATESLPIEQRAWQCPYCPAGLPMLATRRDTHVAVENHRRTCHPEVDTKEWKRDQTRVWAKGVKKPKVSELQLKNHDVRRQQKWPSHDLVAIYNTSEKAAKSRHVKEFWCLSCLGKLAGYGGNCVIRNQQLSCQQAKELPGAQNRVRRAWKCLQHKVQANGQPLSVLQCSQWIRNLLCDGDIESNPGPGSGTVDSRLNVVSLNTQGAAGLWRTLQIMQTDQIHVAMVQEFAMTSKELKAFKNFAFRKGFRFFAQPGSHPEGRPSRGAGVLVQKQLSCHLLKQWEDRECQAVAINVHGMNIISTYFACKAQGPTVPQEILHFLTSTLQNQAWMMAGDFNTEPHEHDLIQLLCQEKAQVLPTRFEGKRCIDYFITNVPGKLSKPHFLEAKVSDHKGICCDFQIIRKKPTLCHALKSWPQLSRPETLISAETWQQTVGHFWAMNSRWDPPKGNNLNQEQIDVTWDTFCARLEQTLHLARRDCYLKYDQGTRSGSTPPPPDLEKSHKNEFVIAQTDVFHGTCKQPGSTFKERKLQRLVFRLAELCQMEKRRQTDTQKYKSLCQKTCRERAEFGDTKNALKVHQKQLQDLRQFQQQEGLKRWRERLQRSDKSCYKWLTDQKITPNVFMQHDNINESLRKIAGFWQEIWNRPTDCEQAYLKAAPHVPEVPKLPSTPMDPYCVQGVLAKMKGKAGSLDGWSGNEVCELPLSVVTELTTLFHLFEKNGKVPQQWYWIKQSHIPKKPDATECRDFRPISVMSIWYRAWSSSRFRQGSTQKWISEWLPKAAVAGKKGAEVWDALLELDFSKHVISLDFKLAFDHVHPQLACAILKQLGIDKHIVGILQEVWSNQKRWLFLDNCIYPQNFTVGTSIPQGDCWSILAMLCVLVAPTRDLCTRFPNVTLKTFIDDRTFIGPVDDVLQMKQEWHVWSQHLGLVENSNKTVHFHRNAAGQKRFVTAGVPRESIFSHPRILGCQLVTAKGRTGTESETARLQDAVRLIRKSQYLPLPWSRKKVFLSAQALSRGAWGWFWRIPTVKECALVQNAVTKALQESNCSSVHLRHILRGHNLNFRFRIVSELVGALHRHVAKNRKVPDHWQCDWVRALCKACRLYGWFAVSPWKFHHVQLGSISFNPQNIQKRDLVLHKLRESFRRYHFYKHVNGSRRDACQGSQYNADRCAWARKMAGEERCFFQVLSGATVSPAAFAVMKRQEPSKCAWCHLDVVPTLKHVAWECKGLQQERCQFLGHHFDAIVNREELQKRFGWPGRRFPLHDESHECILRWLACVRKKILNARYTDQG